MTERRAHSAPPLVVDLDGTLLKTDLLAETASAFLAARPLRAPCLVSWLAVGKCRLKAELAGVCGIDPAALPYNEPLLAWLREQKAQGRRLVLATASHRLLAEAVARHLGLFDEVLATEGETNLKAGRKRDLLVSLYGEGGYDYVGNDSADIEVWRCAGRAHVVCSSPGLLARARALGNLGQVFDGGKPPAATALFKALRPHQWVKNLLVLVPLFAAHRYNDQASLVLALLAFAAFGLTASSVYLLNDLVDLDDDRHHPSKRRRPFASGDLSLASGWLAWPLLLLAAFTLSALLLPPLFTGVLALYFLATLAYSLRLKRTAIVDVVTLAGLYTLRIIAGVAAISVPLSFWLLTFSMFLFLSLAFVKRYSELKSAEEAGGPRHSPRPGLQRRGHGHGLDHGHDRRQHRRAGAGPVHPGQPHRRALPPRPSSSGWPARFCSTGSRACGSSPSAGRCTTTPSCSP